ncbi:MAG: ABC transporter ATP-binding protein [Caulobacteraceae bacterium]|nr:ABC transporter ATP-binding protein [Caulobacter sp.]
MSLPSPSGTTQARPLSNGAVLGFVARQWARRPWMLGFQVALMLAATGCDIAIPWAAGRLVDAVGGPGRALAVAASAAAVLTALYVLLYGLRTGAYRIMNRFAATNMQEVATDAFSRVQRFSAEWHADSFAGATVRRVSRAMQGYDNVSDAVFLMLGPTVVVLGGMAASIAVRWPLIGLFTAAVIVAYGGLNLVLTSRWVRPANLRSNALDSEIGAALADAIGGNAAVKSFGAEAREDARFGALAADWREATIRTWDRFNNLSVIQNGLLVLLQGGLIGLLLLAWARGHASPGDVAFGVSAFLLMAGYLRSFPETARNLQRGLDDVMDAAAFARTPPQVGDAGNARDLVLGAREPAGEIVFDRVTFGYSGAAEPLYRDFSLAIAPGERIALVGPTGSGKSTFVKLLQRLYDLDAGRILIDGQDIAAVTQQSLRRAIALVPQEPALFHRSIAENIAYARPDATPDEVALAARRARADGFIERLPQGYDTLVGERGVKLSGGERQRVAIARAFLADAPILVLDEATSSLDVQTEKLVAEGVEALMAGRTTVVIAHRLSTVRGADRILVFDGGRIVEEGRHEDLLARDGAYARLTAAAETG